MAWALGPVKVEDGDKLKETLDVAFGALDDSDEPDAKGDRSKQLTQARGAIKTLIESGQAGDGPFEVSVAGHPPVPDSGSKPYLSISVVSTA